jgi:hypothetical protein
MLRTTESSGGHVTVIKWPQYPLLIRNHSPALLVFPGHKITMLIVYNLLKNHCKPCFMHECQMRCPLPGMICVKVDHPDPPSLYYVTGVVRTAPPPFSLLQTWLVFLSWVLSNNSLVPWTAVAWTFDSWLVLTHHHHQLQHLHSSTTHEKE